MLLLLFHLSFFNRGDTIKPINKDGKSFWYSQNSPYYPNPQEESWIQVTSQISSSHVGLAMGRSTLVMNNTSINKNVMPFWELFPTKECSNHESVTDLQTFLHTQTKTTIQSKKRREDKYRAAEVKSYNITIKHNISKTLHWPLCIWSWYN